MLHRVELDTLRRQVPVNERAATPHKLPFGIRRETGRIVCIDEVARGRACDCVCPSCGGSLIARKGQVQTHHFAHDHTAQCTSGYETALHILAKELVAQHRQVTIPAIGSRPRRSVCFDEVELERWDPVSRRIPDLVGRIGQHECWIEIAVTHFADTEKIGQLRTSGRKTFEIDLSAHRHSSDRAEIRKAVLSGAPREWLYHPAIEAQAAQAAAEVAASEAERRRRAAALRWRRLCRVQGVLESKSTPDPKADRLSVAARDEVERAGMSPLLRPYPFPQQFTAHYSDWQAALICLLRTKKRPKCFDALGWLESRGFVKTPFLHQNINDLPEHLEDLLGRKYVSPSEIVISFQRSFEQFRRESRFYRAAERTGYARTPMVDEFGSDCFGLALDAIERMAGRSARVVFKEKNIVIQHPNFGFEELYWAPDDLNAVLDRLAASAVKIGEIVGEPVIVDRARYG